MMRDKTFLVIVIATLIFLFLPQFVGPYALSLLISIFYYAYLGQCWNIIGGYAGQASLGHAAFFGVGAYTSAKLAMAWGISPWLGMIAGGVLAAILALFIGSLGFRFGLRGAYFMLLTLAFSEILRLLVLHTEGLGGYRGLFIPFRGESWLNFQFRENRSYYYVALGFLIISIVVVRGIERSKLGHYFIAIREDENTAESIGINTFAYKLAAFTISAFLTALGGVFYAHYFYYLHPDNTFSVVLSVDMLLRPIVGGNGTLFGPFIGSCILTPLSEFSRTYFVKGGYEGLHLMIYGALLIFVVLFFPRGVYPTLVGMIKKF